MKTKTNSQNMIKVTQIRSPIARSDKQRKTLIGLGLNKMHKSMIHNSIPEINGMIKKVQHLIKVEIV